MAWGSRATVLATLACIVLGQALGAAQLLGGALVMGGVLVAQLMRRPDPEAAPIEIAP